MVTALGTIVVLTVLGLAVLRYGADSRSPETADQRDPARPRGPQYAHTPAADLRLVAAFVRGLARQRRLWAAYDRSLRPWETERSGARPSWPETERSGARPSWPETERSGARPSWPETERRAA